MAADSAAQSRQKLELVSDALGRVGGLKTLPNSLQLQCSGAELGYRNRARLHISERGELGFVARKSHGVVPIERCAVCSDRFNGELERLAGAFAPAEPLAAIACRTFAELELRTLAVPSEVRLLAREGQARVPRELNPWLQRLAAQFDLSCDLAIELAAPPLRSVRLFSSDDETLLHARLASARATGRLDAAAIGRLVALEVDVGPGVFTQVNWAVNGRIVAELVCAAIEGGHRRFVDLYSGNGNFSLPLLTLGLQGLGIEQNPRSVQCAQHAAKRQGLVAEFRVGSVGEQARALQRDGEAFDLVVLDPAREGAGAEIEDIARIATRDIFYCACDPVSLARDLRWLTGNGFELVAVAAHDMFPQTHHVETTAWLTRRI